MKHTLYEDPITHKFALIRLPDRFADGDKLLIPTTARWFDSHEEAIAALPDLFNRDESEADGDGEPAAPMAEVVIPVVPPKPH